VPVPRSARHPPHPHSSAVWGQFVPDHERTPGAIDPGIKQENIADTICVPGYTKTVRPPSSYTAQLKREQMRELRLPGTSHDYHEDHLIPLCVGGHPSDPRNLWPEPMAGQWSASMKDQLESSVCRAVYREARLLRDGMELLVGYLATVREGLKDDDSPIH
jgi:hypothetical protein